MDTGAEVAKRFYKELTDIQVHTHNTQSYSVFQHENELSSFYIYNTILLLNSMAELNTLGQFLSTKEDLWSPFMYCFYRK